MWQDHVKDIATQRERDRTELNIKKCRQSVAAKGSKQGWMDGNTHLVSILTPSAVKSWKILTITLPSVAITLTFFLNVKKSRTVIGPNSANHRGKRYNLDNRIVGHRNDSPIGYIWAQQVALWFAIYVSLKVIFWRLIMLGFLLVSFGVQLTFYGWLALDKSISQCVNQIQPTNQPTNQSINQTIFYVQKLSHHIWCARI